MPRLYDPQYLATRRARVSNARLVLDLTLAFGLLAIGVADWAGGGIAAGAVFGVWLAVLALSLAFHA